MDVGDWLRELGLGQYEATFRDNAIEADILPDLTESDFEKLGLLLGHRKRLLKAISSLDPSVIASAPVSHGTTATAAERRQITVMFCDLVGSTAMSTRLDPEDLRTIIGSYHRCCAALVEHHGGFVAKYMGDGVLAYFGYPQAHEHDAERAVQAGLALTEAVPKLTTPANAPLEVRIGIATGLVVVGDLVGSGDAQERGVVGETPNLAARLQGLAEPGMVVLSDSTRRLIGNLFDLTDLGRKDLKGIDGLVRVWAALRPSAVASRFDALRVTGPTALVGREEEMELLIRRWSRASGGEGQVILLSGEAGIGKSRLSAALMERLVTTSHTQLRFFCSAQRTDSALHPVIAQLERVAGFAHDDTPVARLDKFDTLLAQTATPPEHAALLAELLSLPNDGRYPELKLPAPQRRQRTLQALIAQMEVLAGHSPVLMIFEDAHWTDPTSLELFGRIVDRIAALPVLLVVTSRPEFNAPWIGRPHVSAITLNRLVQRDAGAIIDSVAGAETLPADIRRAIIERTDGIPLFVEEMTRAVVEAGNESDSGRASTESSTLAVPASLHASLMARLDRLGPAKEIVQVGAAIGREFSHALLAVAAGKSEAELRQALDRIVEAGLVVRQGVPPQATYLLKHALVQDAAYGMLLREPRRALHARIAAALETQFADTAEAEPEVLANHFSRADLPDQAARSFERAGDRAAARSAYAEAVAHFSAALMQLSRLPTSEERSRRELAVLFKQGPAVLTLRGLRNTDIEQIYQHAYDIARELADEHGLFKALWGLWFFANLGRRTDVARERVAELILLSQRSGDEALLLEAIHCRWSTAFFSGDVADIFESVRDGLKLYDREKHSRLGAEFGGHDPGVCAYTVRGTAFAQVGDRRQAIENIERGVELARAVNQPSSEIFAMINALYTYQMLGDRPGVLNWASKMLDLANRFELPAQRSTATFLAAWAGACDGNLDAGLKAMEAEFDRVSRLGPLPVFYVGLMARVRIEAGQAAQALELLDDIIKTVREPGVGIYVPEIHRLRGECLLRLHSGDFSAAIREFETAIVTAKRQQARIFQLAAAFSLAQASADAGRAENAVAPLREAVEALGDDCDAAQLAQAREWLAAHS